MFEHYNPLARYAMMADGEQIHSAMFPGSMFGNTFAQKAEINVSSMHWILGVLSLRYGVAGFWPADEVTIDPDITLIDKRKHGNRADQKCFWSNLRLSGHTRTWSTVPW